MTVDPSDDPGYWIDPTGGDALTTCTVQITGGARRVIKELLVGYADLAQVLDEGSGRVVTYEGVAYDLTWDTETGYTATPLH